MSRHDSPNPDQHHPTSASAVGVPHPTSAGAVASAATGTLKPVDRVIPPPEVVALFPPGREIDAFKYLDDEQLIIQALNSDGTPRRPMNAFMIFARRRRPQVSSHNPNMRTGEISKILSREWATMPMSEKEFFLDQAKRLKDIFNSKYPDYVYRRRPNNSRRKPKTAALCPPDQRDDSSDGATTHAPYDFPSPSDGQDDSSPTPSAQTHHPRNYPPPSADYYTPRLHAESRTASDFLSHGHSHSPSSSSSSTYSPYVYPAPAEPPHDSWHRGSSTGTANHSSWAQPPPAPGPPGSQYPLRGQRSLTALQTARSPQPSGLPSAGPPSSSGVPPPQRPWSAATSAGSPSSASSSSAPYPPSSTSAQYPSSNSTSTSYSSAGGSYPLHPVHPPPPHNSHPYPPPSPGPTSGYYDHHHPSPAPAYSHDHATPSSAFGVPPPSYHSMPHYPPPGSASAYAPYPGSRDAPRSAAQAAAAPPPPHPYASTGSIPSRSTVMWDRTK